MSKQISQVQPLSLPTLADLDPIANYIAIRFALSGVSKNKLYQILEVFHYQCLKIENNLLILELAKLSNWLRKSSSSFRDQNALCVLLTVLSWYDTTAQNFDDLASRQKLKQSLSEFMALMAWKFEAPHVDKFQVKSPQALGLTPGNIELKLYDLQYKDRNGNDMFTIVKVSSPAKLQFQQYHKAITSINQTIEKLPNLNQAKTIREQLKEATQDWGWAARLAVGIPIAE